MKKALKIISSGIAILIMIVAAVLFYFKEELRDKTRERLCDKGNAVECFNLGLINQNKKDFKKAKMFYKMGCDGGEANACYNYGHLFMDGIGDVRDRKITEEYYIKACDLDQISACNYLSIFYRIKTPGIKRDSKKGIIYAKRVCELDEKFCNLGEAYFMDGQFEKAETYFSKYPESISMAQVKLIKGEKEEAYRIYKKWMAEDGSLSLKRDLDDLEEVYPKNRSDIEELKNFIDDSLLKYLDKDYEKYHMLCFEKKIYSWCYPFSWAAILTKKLDLAEKALIIIKKELPAPPSEFNYGHILLLKGDKDEALAKYILSFKKVVKTKDEKIKTIKEDFKLLSEVYPEKIEEFKEMEETLIEFVESSEN